VPPGGPAALRRAGETARGPTGKSSRKGSGPNEGRPNEAASGAIGTPRRAGGLDGNRGLRAFGGWGLFGFFC